MDKKGLSRAAAVLCGVLVACSAFAGVPAGPAARQPGRQPSPGFSVHGGTGGIGKGIPLSEALKRMRLETHPYVTIGDAFEKYRYFSKVEWQVRPALAGKTYVDCIGHLKKKWFWQDSRALEVKFVVYSDGEFGVVMVSRLDYPRDGAPRRQPLPDVKGVLDTIYADRELPFQPGR